MHLPHSRAWETLNSILRLQFPQFSIVQRQLKILNFPRKSYLSGRTKLGAQFAATELSVATSSWFYVRLFFLGTKAPSLR